MGEKGDEGEKGGKRERKGKGGRERRIRVNEKYVWKM